MMSIQWVKTASSNIALIKYMGKTNPALNHPSNASLSYTLPHLQTIVELTLTNGTVDQWEPIQREGFHTPTFSQDAILRFLNQLARIKEIFQFSQGFIVRSGNNFPHGAGLASSASSFAALTMAACEACAFLTNRDPLSTEEQARLSKQGSGSSCRSFYAPWTIWQEDQIYPIDLGYSNLIHQVIVVDANEKQVSSSEAHRRVLTSPYFDGRTLRANTRLNDLIQALQTQQWDKAYDLCLAEFLDMHNLFHTANPAFRYINDQTNHAIDLVQAVWKAQQDGPLITLDAGPNIHLLYRADQHALSQQVVQQLQEEHYHVL